MSQASPHRALRPSALSFSLSCLSLQLIRGATLAAGWAHAQLAAARAAVHSARGRSWRVHSRPAQRHAHREITEPHPHPIHRDGQQCSNYCTQILSTESGIHFGGSCARNRTAAGCPCQQKSPQVTLRTKHPVHLMQIWAIAVSGCGWDGGWDGDSSSRSKPCEGPTAPLRTDTTRRRAVCSCGTGAAWRLPRNGQIIALAGVMDGLAHTSFFQACGATRIGQGVSRQDGFSSVVLRCSGSALALVRARVGVKTLQL